MWNTIEKAIAKSLDSAFTIEHKQKILGGEINQHFMVSGGTHQYFVKLNNHDAYQNFEAEAYNLAMIEKYSPISGIKVIVIGKTLSQAFIVLSHLSLSSPASLHWFELGKQLALLHQNTQHGQFGWEFDNYIGATRQPNPWMTNWRTFFAEQRIGWQLQLLHEKSIEIGDIDYITSVCHDGLQHHHPTPCLVHGDLWKGNVGFNETHPIIFDPACYYGDCEVDIAMTELFGRFPQEFYDGYQSLKTLDSHYQQRKFIYNFYHLLNHANLFGNIYIKQAKTMFKRIEEAHA